MKISLLFMWLFIFIVGSLIVSFLIYPSSFESFKSNVKSISDNVINKLQTSKEKLNKDNPYVYVKIKDLNQNPSNYIGKEINIKGKLNNRFGGISLEDNNGYWVWIGNDQLGAGCIENQREYNYESQTYSVKGEWIKPKPATEWGFDWGVEYKYHLSCGSSLN